MPNDFENDVLQAHIDQLKAERDDTNVEMTIGFLRELQEYRALHDALNDGRQLHVGGTLGHDDVQLLQQLSDITPGVTFKYRT